MFSYAPFDWSISVTCYIILLVVWLIKSFNVYFSSSTSSSQNLPSCKYLWHISFLSEQFAYDNCLKVRLSWMTSLWQIRFVLYIKLNWYIRRRRNLRHTKSVVRQDAYLLLFSFLLFLKCIYIFIFNQINTVLYHMIYIYEQRPKWSVRYQTLSS